MVDTVSESQGLSHNPQMCENFETAGLRALVPRPIFDLKSPQKLPFLVWRISQAIEAIFD